MAFKDNLIELRKSRGLSQEQLAKDLGLTQAAVSAYEVGTRVPRDDMKPVIAKYFGVSVGSIFFDD